MSPSSASSLVVPFRAVEGSTPRSAHLRCSTVADGDFHLDGPRPALLHRRQAFMPGLWTQLDEVHGTAVHRVTRPGEHDFATGDALWTDVPGAVLGIWVGDCAPLVVVADNGLVGAAHVGWRGALGGVVGALLGELRAAGAIDMKGYLGPCIHPCCYEFGADDLRAAVDRFGPSVAARTAWDTPALDMPAVVRAALAEHDVELREPAMMAECTGCHPQRYFSHRRRAERGRQMMAVCIRSGE